MAQSKVQRNSRVSQGTHPADVEELADRFMEEVRVTTCCTGCRERPLWSEADGFVPEADIL